MKNDGFYFKDRASLGWLRFFRFKIVPVPLFFCVLCFAVINPRLSWSAAIPSAFICVIRG